MSSCFRSNPPSLLLLLLLSLFLFIFSVSASRHSNSIHDHDGEIASVRQYNARRSVAEEDSTRNASLVLAQQRTTRKDPLDNFNLYTGGWNISNQHYYASVAFTAAPFFIVAAVWFVVFGLCLCFIGLCSCCCPREHYGYSRIAYALSLILLIICTLAAIIGCIILYVGQGKIYKSTTHTLNYVVSQADYTAENLRIVSSYLDTAKGIAVDTVVLPSDVQNNINGVKAKIDTAAATLSSKTGQNSKDIQVGIDGMRLALVILAAVMLLLTFLGFLCSIFGMQCLLYFFVVIGWILVASTFIKCGVFLFLHNVIADTCVAMDEWVENPTAHTALDDIIPCVDKATANESLFKSHDVTYRIVTLVDTIITNVTNSNSPTSDGPTAFYNQSGPLMPLLCSPFNSDLTDRQCGAEEVALNNASEVWKNYVCEVSPAGNCITPGRMTPGIYSQMAAAVNVSDGLYRYSPFLINLVDCTFVRETFTDINNNHCPGLRKYSKWIYVGLVIVSVAVMLSLIFWVIYARERRHRVYTKKFMATAY